MNIIKYKDAIRKNSAMLINVISLVLIILSVESVTTNGIREGRTTFYKTISFSSKPFHLYGNNEVSYLLLNGLFFIGIAITIFTAVKLFKSSKIKSILLIFVDIIGMAVIFLMFLNGNYLLMMGIVETMYMLQISLQTPRKNASSIVAIALSIAIWIINLYFLIKQFMMMIGVADVTDILLNELIKVSRTNAICVALFIVPCIISLIGSMKETEIH